MPPKVALQCYYDWGINEVQAPYTMPRRIPQHFLQANGSRWDSTSSQDRRDGRTRGHQTAQEFVSRDAVLLSRGELVASPGRAHSLLHGGQHLTNSCLCFRCYPKRRNTKKPLLLYLRLQWWYPKPKHGLRFRGEGFRYLP